jgi:hypothetical protein
LATADRAQRVVDGQVADLDGAEGVIRRIPLGRVGQRRGSRAQQAGVVRRLHHDRVPASLGMLRDARVAGDDHVVRGGLAHVEPVCPTYRTGTEERPAAIATRASAATMRRRGAV